jgi:hypothetical protein
MIRILSGIAACLTLALLITPCRAEDDPAPNEMVEGFVTARGFRFHNNLWWQNGQSFTRRKVYFTAYRPYGCCGQTQAYTDYNVVYTPYVAPYAAPTVTVNVPAYTPDWQTEALKTLAKRDDLNAYQNTVASLNSTAIQSNGGYGGVTANSYLASGTTLYQKGNFNALNQSLYGLADINLANMLAARTTTNAQTLAGQAHSDFTALISQQSAGQERVALIAALAQNSQPQPTLQATTFQFAPQNAQDSQQAPIMPKSSDDTQGPSGPSVALQAVWNAKCAKCHTGQSAAKGFTLQTYLAMDRKTKIDRVWTARLKTTDPNAIMPRDPPPATTGHPLDTPSLKAFYDDVASTGAPTAQK